MLSLRIQSKSFPALAQLSKPQNTSDPETLPDVLYDTQTYPALGTNQLSYFTAVNADTTLCNLEAAGMLPAPQYFEIHRIFADFLQPGSATCADDVSIFLTTCRPTFVFTMKAKQWGPIPLRFMGRSGAPTPYADGSAVSVATTGDLADNGGFPVNGSITIPPNTQFRVTLNFNATPVTTATLVRIGFLGVKHRLVA